MVNKMARKPTKTTKPRTLFTKGEVLARMAAHAEPDTVAGKARYGIAVDKAFGVSLPFVRGPAKQIGTDHKLARSLWATAIPECRLLAPMIADPEQADDRLLESWVADLNSWDACDGFCASLVSDLPVAWDKAVAWSKRDEEFVRRAGYALMATLAVHAKDAPDAAFRPFLKRIEAGASDARNFVKKAANWALRQIGKRNAALTVAAIACAERILAQDTAPARWVARDGAEGAARPRAAGADQGEERVGDARVALALQSVAPCLSIQGRPRGRYDPTQNWNPSMETRNERDESIWLRLVFMILFAIAFNIAEFVLFVVACIQFLVKAFSGRVLAAGTEFGQNLATYIYEIIRFLTFRTNDMPWPFAPWPDGAPDDACARPTTRTAGRAPADMVD